METECAKLEYNCKYYDWMFKKNTGAKLLQDIYL